jgi:hypothetical protein
MTLLRKFFGGHPATNITFDSLHCRHESLAPMWENIHDMGETDKITRYRCLGCGLFLSAAAAPQDAHRGQATTSPSSVTPAAA